MYLHQKSVHSKGSEIPDFIRGKSNMSTDSTSHSRAGRDWAGARKAGLGTELVLRMEQPVLF